MELIFLSWFSGVALQLCQAELWKTPIYILLLIFCSIIIFTYGIQSRQTHPICSLYLGNFWSKRFFYCLLILGIGFSWSGWFASGRLVQAISSELEGQDITIIGHVEDLPQKQDNRWHFVFHVDEAQHLDKPVKLPEKVLLSWYTHTNDKNADKLNLPDIRSGERWKMEVRLKAPHGSINPHGFDYELWLWTQNIGATGYVRTGKTSHLPQLLSDERVWSIASIRESVRTQIRKTIQNPQQAGLLAALTLGDQQSISRADWKTFRITGVAHLVSISGLHITMMAWLGYWFIGWCWRRSMRLMLWLPAHSAAAVGGMLCALFYALFAGWGIPAQRTVLMLATVVLLRLAGIRWPWHVTLLFAAVVVVTFDPWALLQPGFWLSFVAVAVLLIQGDHGNKKEALDKLVAQPQRSLVARSAIAVMNGMKELLRIQLYITLALAPLTLLLFQQVSLVGLIANFLAIPWVTFVMVPLALVGIFWHACWYAAAWAGSLLMLVLKWLENFPVAVWEGAVPPWSIGLLAVLAAIGMIYPKLRLRYRILCVPLMLLAFLWQSPTPAVGEFEVLALDVGQGSAVLVRTAKHALLYDTGAKFSAQSDAGELIVVPVLRAMGVRLDKVVISHVDSDHSGGLRSVQEAYPDAELLASAPADSTLWQLPFKQKEICVAGMLWVWDDVEFTVLHPFEVAENITEENKKKISTNEQSCVLRIASSHTGSSAVALLTGDVEEAQEAAIINQFGNHAQEILKADWLLMPHHGSNTSSSKVWIDTVKPSWAVAQAGYLNRFQHPHQQVLDRYQNAGVFVTNTIICGAALWQSHQPDEIHCSRQERRRYWHHQVNVREK